jgi:hypothetical protein
MNSTEIYGKTAKGLLFTKTRGKRLSKGLMQVFPLIDGKSTIEKILRHPDAPSEFALEQAILELLEEGYIKFISGGTPLGHMTVEAGGGAGMMGFSVSDANTQMFQDAEAEVRAKKAIKERSKKTASIDLQDIIDGAIVSAGVENKAHEAEEKKQREENERKQRETMEAERLAREAAALKAREEAEQQAKLVAEKKARQEAEQAARKEAERVAREQAEALARQAAEDQKRLEAEKREKEEKARRESEQRLREEAEAKSKAEAEVKVRHEEEEKARQNAERVAREQAEALARQAVEDQKRLEAEKREKEERSRRESEQRLREEAEAKAKAEAEAQIRREEEEKARQEAENAAREAAKKARLQAEAEEREEAEARARQERRLAARAREEAEAKAKADAEEQARIKAEVAAILEAEQIRIRAAEEGRLREQAEAEEQARLKAQKKVEEEAELNRALEEAKAKARAESEERARLKAEKRTREKAELKRVRAEAKAQARAEAEEQERLIAEEKAQEEAEQQRFREKEAAEANARAIEQARLEMEEEARLEAERQSVREEAEARDRAEELERARREGEEEARAEAELAAAQQHANEEAETQARLAAEQAKRDAEDKALHELEAAEQKRLDAAAAAEREAEVLAWEKSERLAREREEKSDREAAKARKAMEKQEKARARSEALAQGKDTAIAYVQHILPGKRVILTALLLLVAVPIVLLHLLSLDFLIEPAQKLASERLHDTVTVRSIRASLWPAPNFMLEGVTIGEKQEVVVPVITVTPVLFSLGEDITQLKSVEIESLAVTGDLLARLPIWFAASDRLVQLEFSTITLKNAHLAIKDSSLPPFNAQASFGAAGRFESAQISDLEGKAEFTVSPAGEALRIVLKAHDWKPLLGLDLHFSSLDAEATADRQALSIKSFDGLVFGGRLTADGKIQWKKDWSAEGGFKLAHVQLSKVTPALDGKLEASGSYVFSADQPWALFAAPQVRATFKASEGRIAGIDLARAIKPEETRSVSGGETTFSELSGAMSYSNQRYQFQRVRMQAGLLNTSADFDLSKEQATGRIAVALESRATAFHTEMTLSGTPQAPVLNK